MSLSANSRKPLSAAVQTVRREFPTIRFYAEHELGSRDGFGITATNEAGKQTYSALPVWLVVNEPEATLAFLRNLAKGLLA